MDVLQAISKTNTPALKQALAAGGDANQADQAGVPVLLHAADTGDPALVQALLDAGADLEGRDNIGWTALMAAIAQGSEALITHLLAAGANTNHVAREDTALTFAVADASDAIIRSLLSHGADTNLRRPDGWTPLMLAAFEGKRSTLQLLLEAGADPTICLGPRLTDAATIAAANAHTEAAQLLADATQAAHPDPGEFWEAIKAWCEDRAPSIAERFERNPSTSDLPEEWGELPADLHNQLSGWSCGLPFYDYHGLDLPASVALAKELCEQGEQGEFIGRNPSRLGEDEPIARQHWSTGWVPVARDAEGNLLLVDLDPRPTGLRGQFISWSVQDGPLSVLASSITPWLRHFVSELRRGHVRFEPHTETLVATN